MTETARRFFEQLAVFSQRYFQKIGIKTTQSPWVSNTSTGLKGSIIHYTADPDMNRVLRWFMVPEQRGRTSAHVVVADRRLPEAEELLDGLPLVDQLPVTVVQCVPPSLVAWHATWCNRSCYGIENLNPGELVKRDNVFVWWKPRDRTAPAWTTPWEGVAPVEASGRWWAPYPFGQVVANAMLLENVRGLFQKTFHPTWVLGHEAVQGVKTPQALGRDKRDPGPLFPIHEVRARVFDGLELHAEMATPEHQQRGLTGFIAEARKAEVGTPEWIVWVLKALGYYARDLTGSVLVFQRMCGLKPDGIVGPNTIDALVKRLADRGLLTPAGATIMHGNYVARLVQKVRKG